MELDRKTTEPGLRLSTALAELALVMLQREELGTFRVLGRPPAWLKSVLPRAERGGHIRPQEAFAFLDNFLVDAEAHWRSRSPRRLMSGLFSERGPDGQRLSLEASAITGSDGRKLLILERADEAHRTRNAFIQRARNLSVQHELLEEEIQKKEILLHCIVHDLASPLGAISCCLEALSEGSLKPGQSRTLLDIARRQVGRQEALIRQILDVFRADLEEELDLGIRPGCDLVGCVREVVEAVAPLIELHRLHLQVTFSEQGSLPLAGPAERLERVLANLLDNAIRHAPRGSRVEVAVRVQGKEVEVSVIDEGPGVPEDERGQLFEKFSQGSGGRGKLGLGLYFCRIAVERWGGRVGYAPGPCSGSRFWFRVPLASGGPEASVNRP